MKKQDVMKKKSSDLNSLLIDLEKELFHLEWHGLTTKKKLELTEDIGLK